MFAIHCQAWQRTAHCSDVICIIMEAHQAWTLGCENTAEEANSSGALFRGQCFYFRENLDARKINKSQSKLLFVLFFGVCWQHWGSYVSLYIFEEQDFSQNIQSLNVLWNHFMKPSLHEIISIGFPLAPWTIHSIYLFEHVMKWSHYHTQKSSSNVMR